MTFDYKKEYKEFYLPPKVPGIADIPAMNYAAVRGKGNPNDPDGEYKRAMSLLYGISFTIKMSYKGSHRIEGYFPYVVPPLEGLWRQDGITGIDYSHKDSFQWISMIRLPEFVTKEEFDWAVQEAEEKKQTDFPVQNFLLIMKGSVSSVCTSGVMTTNPPHSGRWRPFSLKTDTSRISPENACTMKSI